jgi:hypothetical protein
MRLLFSILFSLFALGINAQIQAGPYAPPAEQINSTAIHKDSIIFTEWASASSIVRGNQDITDSSLGLTSVGTNNSATEKSGINGVVSLGDGGIATLTFNSFITNGNGADFAVFENSFSDDFLELAFVEVSSDGINFYRFEAVSLTSTEVQTEGFGLTDPTNIYNLAGKYRAQYGTPFDLEELIGITGLNVNAISHVRIIDVIGNINSTYASSDSQGHIINDPWPTPFASGGFDLDAVGVINSTPTSVAESSNLIQLSMYPNPTENVIYFNFEQQKPYNFSITNTNGQTVLNGFLSKKLNISSLEKGIYFIHIFDNEQHLVKKIIKK